MTPERLQVGRRIGKTLGLVEQLSGDIRATRDEAIESIGRTLADALQLSIEQVAKRCAIQMAGSRPNPTDVPSQHATIALDGVPVARVTTRWEETAVRVLTTWLVHVPTTPAEAVVLDKELSETTGTERDRLLIAAHLADPASEFRRNFTSESESNHE